MQRQGPVPAARPLRALPKPHEVSAVDYINAIGIALFALFGLWAFQKGAEARKSGRRPHPEERPDDRRDDGE